MKKVEFQQCFQEGVGLNAGDGEMTGRGYSFRSGGKGESSQETGRPKAFSGGEMTEVQRPGSGRTA